MRLIVTLLFILPFTPLIADVGSNWPSKDEMDKAPSWPKKYTGDPTKCKKIDRKIFLSQFGKPEESYVIERQVDLNLDGICEVITYAPAQCGKWCAYDALQLQSNKLVHIGEVALGEYLVPYNGWLQIRSRSYTGRYYYYHLLRRINGKYQYYRKDEYQESYDSGKTKYIRTTTHNNSIKLMLNLPHFIRHKGLTEKENTYQKSIKF